MNMGSSGDVEAKGARPLVHNVLLSIEFEEGVLARYAEILHTDSTISNVGSALGRRFELELGDGRSIEYNLIVALGIQDAKSLVSQFAAQGQEFVAAIFEIADLETSGYTEVLGTIRTVFPNITFAVISPYSEQSFDSIRALFKSPDEWLYFDSESVSGPELEQMIRNLITTYLNHREREQALETLRQGQEGLREILTGSSKLLRIQEGDQRYREIVEQAHRLGGGEGSFLALPLEPSGWEVVATTGRYIGWESASEFAQKDPLRSCVQNALESGTPTSSLGGLLLPLRMEARTIGLLQIDRDRSTHLRDDILELFGNQAALALDMARLRVRERRAQAMENELSVAARIQSRLLPRKIPDFPGLELHGFMRPARVVGGDYFDIIPVNRDDVRELFVTIGDVAGKGVPAGLLMSEMRASIRALIGRYRDPRKILSELAPLLLEDLQNSPGKFISLLVMRWTMGKSKMIFSSAGHEHILHYRAKDESCSAHRSGGVVVGVPLAFFERGIQNRGITMAPGDVLLLFTDGVTEALAPTGEMFGLERLVERFRFHARHWSPVSILQSLEADLDRFTLGQEVRDDITLLAIRFTG